MTDQASKLVALVRADGAARLARQRTINEAERARIIADAVSRDERWLAEQAAKSPLHRAAYEMSRGELDLYETDR